MTYVLISEMRPKGATVRTFERAARTTIFSAIWATLPLGMAYAQQIVTRVEGPQRLVMPYACTIEGGIVRVQPSPERVFELKAGRQYRSFTTCDPPFSNNCETMILHRFDLPCAGSEVPWVRVVAAIRRTKLGTADLENGHVVLTRSSSRLVGAAPSCSRTASNSSRNGHPLTDASGECLPWKTARPSHKIILPQGFAPAEEVGARFIEMPGRAIGERSLVSSFAAMGAQPSLDASSGENILSDFDDDGLRELTQAALAEVLPADADPWAPTIQLADMRSLRHEAPQESHAWIFGVFVAVLGSILLAAAAVVRLRNPLGVRVWTETIAAQLATASQSVTGWARTGFQRAGVKNPLAVAACGVANAGERVRDALHSGAQSARALVDRARTRNADAADEGEFADLFDGIAQAVAVVRERVGGLGAAPVVQEVLAGDLARLEERLAALRAQADSGCETVIKITAQLRLITRELDRIAGLAARARDGIAVNGPGQQTAAPQTGNPLVRE